MLRSLMNKILSMQPPSFKGLQIYDFLNLWFYWIHGSKRQGQVVSVHDNLLNGHQAAIEKGEAKNLNL